jgi:hypothetical protein
MHFAAFLVLLTEVAPASAQTPSTKCTYTNLTSNKTISGECTVGSAGVAITEPASGMLTRISITIKNRQGEWAAIEINGASGFRYEIDRCTFRHASEDLKQFLDTQVPCEAPKIAQKSDRPVFMTAGGAWVGKWYTGKASVCTGKRGESEGLLHFTTTKLWGYESECDVESIKPVGAGVEVVSKCYGEGMASREREYLEVVDDKLKRTTLVQRKRLTFTYNRCPS